MIQNDRRCNAIVLRREGAILHIELDAPHIRNALTQVQMLALRDVLAEASRDRTIRVVSLRGAGGHFCGGGAIDSFGQRPPGEEGLSDAERRERRIARLEACAEISDLLRTMPKPTVALIEGAAAGAGMIYALSCDLSVVSETAFFCTAYSRLGVSGDMGAAPLLMTIVGRHRAGRLLMMAERLHPGDMQKLGIISEIVPASDFETRADALLAQLAAGPPLAYAAIKENLNMAENQPRAATVRKEAENMVRTLESADTKEAQTARAERRAPQFTGE